MIDFHCDVLAKLLEDRTLKFHDDKKGKLDVTYDRLRASNAIMQTFAIYIPTHRSKDMVPILESVDLFYEKVIACDQMKLILSANDLNQCMHEGKTGAMLSLEGVDGLAGNLSMLRILYRLGVRAAGLTWNHANWAADGVMESRGGGLTQAGTIFIEECERLGIILDVSHLSEQAFWDVEAMANRAYIASHSNAKGVCDHPRNLSDQQLKAIFTRNGRVGITYVPWFVAQKAEVAITDLLRHVDYMCALGGEQYIMLGSDFDGIDSYIKQLSHPGELYHLKEALLKHYSEEQTNKFMAGNAISFLQQHLPATC